MAYSCPLTQSHIKAACLGEPRDGEKGREVVGIREEESVSEGEVGGGGRGGCLDGGIPYLLLRGCCSVVRDCLELPPVPGIFEGNSKACDGPDLLELPFFYVSLHFLLCYIPPPPSSPLSLALLSFSYPSVSLTPSDSALTPFFFLWRYLTFHQAAANILIRLCSSASSSCRTIYTCDPPETRAR